MSPIEQSAKINRKERTRFKMRKKSTAHHVPTVIDLTVQQLPPVSVSCVERQPQSAQKSAKFVREKKHTAKVRKVCTKTQKVVKKPSNKRKRIQQEAPVQNPSVDEHNGLYQLDLTHLISQKLKTLFEPPVAHSSSTLPSYDPRHIWRRQPMMMGFVAPNVVSGPRMAHLSPPHMCSVPGCSQEAAVSSALRFVGGPPGIGGQLGRRQFSIFRSVELMAQSSCLPSTY